MIPPKVSKLSSYKFWKMWIPFNEGVLVLNSAFKPFIESIKIIFVALVIFLSSLWLGIIYLFGIYIAIMLLFKNSLNIL